MIEPLVKIRSATIGLMTSFWPHIAAPLYRFIIKRIAFKKGQ